MNSNTGDQSRQDLEARLDKILREPEATSVINKPSQPDTTSAHPGFTPKNDSVIEQVVIPKKAEGKTLSDYFRPFTKSLLQIIKSSQDWLVSGVRRAKSTSNKKSRVGFGNRVNKPLAFVLAGAGVTVAVVVAVLVNISYLTVTTGIETNLGTSENRTVLTLKANDANQGDLLVASLGLDNETNEEILVIGTVFSKNDQTYALYDGEVIWQITAEQIRGKVLFAEATETP
jgi:hypothetical protein